MFLREVGLEQYTTTLLEHGFDDMETLLLIDDVDLKDLGVRLGHVVKLKKRLREHELRLAGQAAAPLPAPKAEAAAGALPSASGLSEVERSWDQVQAHGVNVVGGLLYRNFFKLAPEARVPRDARAGVASCPARLLRLQSVCSLVALTFICSDKRTCSIHIVPLISITFRGCFVIRCACLCVRAPCWLRVARAGPLLRTSASCGSWT